jgi:hypothetical protein
LLRMRQSKGRGPMSTHQEQAFMYVLLLAEFISAWYFKTIQNFFVSSIVYILGIITSLILLWDVIHE